MPSLPINHPPNRASSRDFGARVPLSSDLKFLQPSDEAIVKIELWLLTLLALVISACTGCADQPTPPIGRIPTSQLIGRLCDVSNDDFAVPTNIIAMGETGDQPMPRGLLKMQDSGPKPAEAVDELARRELESLPELINHLSDARKTKATVDGIMGITYSAELDWNPRTGGERPKGVSALGDFFGQEDRIVGSPDANHYVLAVGDLCFNIIGRIVNRRYDAVRSVPSAVVIVNSPVLCPAVGDAVTKEWSNLSPEEHRRLLIADVAHPDEPGRDFFGIWALARHYPDAVPIAVHERLSLPMYDWSGVRDFAEQKLYLTADPNACKQMMGDFIKSNGPGYRDGLILQLWEDKDCEIGQTQVAAAAIQIKPSRLLAEFLDQIDPAKPPLIDAVKFTDTPDFINALQNINSVAVDKEVFDEFIRCDGRHDGEWKNEDWVAAACIRHLAHKGRDGQPRTFCNRRLVECKDNQFAQQQIHESLDLIGP
jgi:hypothetical protein